MPLGNGHVFIRLCDAVPKRVNVFDLLFFRQRFEAFGEVGKGRSNAQPSGEPGGSPGQPARTNINLGTGSAGSVNGLGKML
jgi:hypothetical protein